MSFLIVFMYNCMTAMLCKDSPYPTSIEFRDPDGVFLATLLSLLALSLLAEALRSTVVAGDFWIENG